MPLRCATSVVTRPSDVQDGLADRGPPVQASALAGPRARDVDRAAAKLVFIDAVDQLVGCRLCLWGGPINSASD